MFKFGMSEKKNKGSKRNKELLLELYYKIINEEDINYFQNYMMRSQKNHELSEIKFTDYEWNPLHLAVWHNKQILVKHILNQPYGKDMINELDLNRETPLHLACVKQNEALLTVLANSGASFDIKNSASQTPLDTILNELERRNFLTSSLCLAKSSAEKNTDALNTEATIRNLEKCLSVIKSKSIITDQGFVSQLQNNYFDTTVNSHQNSEKDEKKMKSAEQDATFNMGEISKSRRSKSNLDQIVHLYEDHLDEWPKEEPQKFKQTKEFFVDKPLPRYTKSDKK